MNLRSGGSRKFVRDAPPLRLKVPSLRDQTPTWTKASALAKEWELNRLAERLDALIHPKPC